MKLLKVLEGIVSDNTCIHCGNITNEDLKKWFKQKWVNIGKKDKSGKHPECGTSGEKRGYAKCVPASKAAGMSKKDKESATRRKRSAQNKANRGGRGKKGQKRAVPGLSSPGDAEAIAKKKALQTAPPLPTTLMLPGQRRQHPKEYFGLTRRETEIFGSLFHSAGSYWPSDKPTFFLMHMMAFNAFKPKLAPFCFDENGKYNYEIITPDLVSQDPNFDHSYFDKLPLANVSEAEITSMKAKFTGIPESAWSFIKYWTKDPRNCSENVCRRRGYI